MDNAEELEEGLTEDQINIYYTVRNNFDLAIQFLEEITGLMINEEYATHILQEYLAAQGYMYYDATCYNIPWMLMYFTTAEPIYGKLVHKESPLYKMLMDRVYVLLIKCKGSPYYKIEKNENFSEDLDYSFILHEKRIVRNKLKEEIHFCLYSSDENGLPMKMADTVLDIDKHVFPCLTHSEKVINHRDEQLLQIAKQLMPDL